ncbi:MAG: AMP-binding protein, partial [Acidimicrobiales bacterium]
MRVPLTIGDFLERAAHVYGDRVAVVDEPEVAGSLGRLTYEDLHHRARALAVGLDSMGVEVGERVGIVSPNSARFLASYFGISGFGRVLVPINYRLTADEIGFIVEHSGATVVLYDPELDGLM